MNEKVEEEDEEDEDEEGKEKETEEEVQHEEEAEKKEKKRRRKGGENRRKINGRRIFSSSFEKPRKNISPAPNIHKELKTFNSGVKQDILFMSYIKFCITR